MGCVECRASGQHESPVQCGLAKSSVEVSDATEAKKSLLALWQQLLNQQCPCTADIFPKASDNFGLLLNSYDDLHAETYTKSICAQGAVCLARVEWNSSEYTGLFRRADYCLLRCSSALPTKLDSPGCPMLSKAPGSLGQSVVMPFVALKVFGTNHGSGNLLFGGRKTGQAEQNFFAHCACTHFTERCNLAMWPVLRMFRKYSDYPTQSGLSDFASTMQDGTAELQPRFPWALILRPVGDIDCHGKDKNFLDQLDGIRPGAALYRILACASPDDAVEGRMQHIGTLVTVSEFVQSALETRLRFRHQLKEEDYEIHPEWKAQLTAKHKNYGWEHFERFQEDACGFPLKCTSWVWQGRRHRQPQAAHTKTKALHSETDSKDCRHPSVVGCWAPESVSCFLFILLCSSICYALLFVPR